jgi:hypothetical protein
MKWQKYADLAATNPIAANILDSLVGPPSLTHGGPHADFTLQQWVEQRLEYVAIRPWERLDMNVTDASEWNAHAAHTLHYHIGGEERVCSRMRWLTDTECNLKFLSEVLAETVEWYEEYWAKQPDRPLVIDAVARKCSAWLEGEEYAKETLNIWLAPEGFQP